MGTSLRPYLVDLDSLRSRFVEASPNTDAASRAELLEELCERIGTKADAPLFSATSWSFIMGVFEELPGCEVLLQARPPVDLPEEAVSPLVTHLTADEAAAAATAHDEAEPSSGEGEVEVGREEVREWLEAAAARRLAIVAFCT